jgi:hypothetical protein
MLTNQYTVIRNGMNFRDSTSNWVESRPVVRSFAGGIVCTGASYSVILSTNLNRYGAVDLQTSDRKRLISHPLGIGYYDPESGRSVLLAEVTNCVPRLVSSNQVVYENALVGSGIEAAVAYTYGIGRFHQNVVFVKQPARSPADFGMGGRTRLEILTEIVEGTLFGGKTRVLKQETNAAVRTRMVEPDLVDETLILSDEMRMSLGRAFLTGPTRVSGSRDKLVAKCLVATEDNRWLLVEAVGWNDAGADFKTLPKQTDPAGLIGQEPSLTRRWPASRLAQKSFGTFETRLAELIRAEPIRLLARARTDGMPAGFVVDYQVVQCVANFSFTGDDTFLIEDEVELTGTTTAYGDGSACIKFNSEYSGLTIYDYFDGGLAFIFTSANDDSVGDIIEGSTGNPMNRAAGGLVLADDMGNLSLDAMEFRYFACAALQVLSGNRQICIPQCTLRNCAAGFGLYCSGLELDIDTLNYCNVSQVVDANENNTVSIYQTGTADCDGDFDNDGLPDGWEMRKFGNLNQTASGDPDGDGFTNLQEYQNGTNPLDPDNDGDGLPDPWERDYFGDTSQTATGDYDGDGVSNIEEYWYHHDPNKIRFSVVVTNQYVRTNTAPIQVAVTGGVPSSVAVLVNDTGFSNAVWQTYASSNLVVSLGTSNGDYQVWIGLRGRLESSYQTWHGATLTLDTIRPVVEVTNPASTRVSTPVIQLQGYVSEPLASLTYDLTNAAGLMTNQEGFITGQHPDTNTWKFTTGYFQAYDVVLTNGENTISLRATDLAGNITTTNVTLTLDENSATNPPGVAILWPLPDTPIAGTNTVLEGTVDDDTASVTVSVGSNVYAAVVERSGRFTVPDLPLVDSTNAVTVAATNGAGFGGSMIAFAVATQKVFSMDAFAPGTISHGLGAVTGRITESGLDLWVNGVLAGINPDGTWQANNVPLRDEAGMGHFYIAAYPNGGHPSGPPAAAQLFTVALPPVVEAVAYIRNRSVIHYSSCGPCTDLDALNQSWEIGLGGESWLSGSRDCTGWHSASLDLWSADYPPISTWQWLSVLTGSIEFWYSDEGNCGFSMSRNVEFDTIQTALRLTAGGPAQGGIPQLIRLVVSVLDGDGLPVPPNMVNIFGKPLTPTTTNADVGELYLTMPAGAVRDLPVTVSGMQNFIVADAQSEEVKLRIVDSLNHTIDYTDKLNTVVVGQKVSLLCQLSLTNAVPTNFQWTVPGFAISNFVVVAIPSSGTVYSNFSTTSSDIDFYWVDGGSNRQVECALAVQGQRAVAKTTFNVLRPTADWIAEPNAVVSVDDNYSRPAVHFGDRYSTNQGMLFHYRNPDLKGYSSPWVFKWAQVGTIYARGNTFTNNVGIETRGAGLDVIFPVNAWFSPTSSGDDQDDPGEWTYERYKLLRQDSFTNYLMFQTLGATSIPVPIKRIEWCWSGLATNDLPNGWALMSSPTDFCINRNNTDTLEFPVWDRNITNRTVVLTNWF